MEPCPTEETGSPPTTEAQAAGWAVISPPDQPVNDWWGREGEGAEGRRGKGMTHLQRHMAWGEGKCNSTAS